MFRVGHALPHMILARPWTSGASRLFERSYPADPERPSRVLHTTYQSEACELDISPFHEKEHENAMQIWVVEGFGTVLAQ